MKKIFLLTALLLTYAAVNAQTFQWAKHIGGTDNDHITCIKTDAQGNVVMSGGFEGTVDFDPGAAVHNLTAINDDDYFILKLDSSGNYLWAVSIEGIPDANLRSKIAVDAVGNILMIGNFKGTVDFDPGAGVFNLTSSSAFTDVFILKLDGNGQLMWAKSFGGSAADDGKDIATDANNNVYATGSFMGGGDFDPGSGVFTMNDNGGGDVFISKLDASGDFIWANSIGGSYSDDGYGIGVDSAGNVYVAGDFLDEVDFDPGSGMYNLTSLASWDPFILKLDGNGNFVWAKQAEGTNAEFAHALKVTPSGDCYMAGIFSYDTDFDPGVSVYNLTSAGQEDVFVLHLNSNGGFVWARQMGGSETDNATAIDLDNDHNIYVTGSFTGQADFDPGSGLFSLDAGGSGTDVFISKLDSSGNFVWAKQIGAEDGNDAELALHCDVENNIYAGGYFEETCDLNTDAGTDNHTSNGARDAFIVKMKSAVSPNDISTLSPMALSVYPNPATDKLHIHTDNTSTDLTVNIISSNGALIRRKYFKGDIAIDVHDLSAGLYSYQIKDMLQSLNICTGSLIVVK